MSNTLTRIRNIFNVGIILLVSATVPAEAQPRQIVYEGTADVLANPGMGWVEDYFSHAEDDNGPTGPYRRLNVDSLRSDRINHNITLILRRLFIHNFVNGDDIDLAYLADLQADFDAMRSAGIKAVIRFAYSNKVNEDNIANWDAPLPVILRHIDTLAPTLNANIDVIHAVEAGFIGVYGEWYYTQNFAEKNQYDNWVPNAQQQEDRRRVAERLLEVLPDHVQVLVRTPAIKRNAANRTGPLTEPEAFNGSAAARIGHHNDCFLASETDYGTYDRSKLQQDLDYMHQDTKFLLMGGETCTNNSFSDCDRAIPRMSSHHWSFLNQSYEATIYDKWALQGCKDEVDTSLGYRIRLVNATIDEQVNPGADLHISMTLINEGFAAPMRYSPIQIVLIDEDTSEQTTLSYTGSNDDTRYWLPGASFATNGTVTIPASQPAGTYRLAIRFPDQAASLANDPAYSIRLANANIWDPSNGMNDLLHTITVGGGTGFTKNVAAASGHAQ